MNDNATTTPAPEMPTPQVKEVRHDFSEAQLETLRPLMEQMGQIQNMLQFFMGHIAREQKLPQPMEGVYQLAIDQMERKPYMIGHVPAENKSNQ